MKLNIVTTCPDKVLCAISEVYPDFHICHTEVCDNIHDFELVKEKENVVYPLDGLKELSLNNSPITESLNITSEYIEKNGRQDITNVF